MRAVLPDRTWDVLIVADEASAALARQLMAELRGLRVTLDAATGPTITESIAKTAAIARCALVLAKVGETTKYAVMRAAKYPGAEVDERPVAVGPVGDRDALVALVLERLG